MKGQAVRIFSKHFVQLQIADNIYTKPAILQPVSIHALDQRFSSFLSLRNPQDKLNVSRNPYAHTKYIQYLSQHIVIVDQVVNIIVYIFVGNWFRENAIVPCQKISIMLNEIHRACT